MKGFYGEPREGKEGIVGGVAKALVKELTGQQGEIVETKIETAKENEYTLGEANYVDGVGVYDGKGDMVYYDRTPEEQRKYVEYQNRFTKSRETNKDFKSSHFDEPNILVHLRMNTRIDAEGNKVLFLWVYYVLLVL